MILPAKGTSGSTTRRRPRGLGAALAARAAARRGGLPAPARWAPASRPWPARLIRALTRPDEEVPSPTFTLVQFYEGAGCKVAHFDLYRLTRPDEAYEIGLDEALDDGAAVIEWPERLERPPAAPTDSI